MNRIGLILSMLCAGALLLAAAPAFACPDSPGCVCGHKDLVAADAPKPACKEGDTCKGDACKCGEACKCGKGDKCDCPKKKDGAKPEKKAQRDARGGFMS